jgi:signal transduction histidine kinase
VGKGPETGAFAERGNGVRDPTETAAIIAREQTFRLSGTPMCVADASGQVLRANCAFERLFGKERALTTLFIQGEARREIAIGLRQAAQYESDVTLEGACATATGAEVTLSWSLRSADRVVLAEAKDVTAIASARRELACKTGEFESVLSALSEVYFRTDHGGQIVAWRAGGAVDAGDGGEDFLGRRPEDIVPVDVAPLIASALARARSERTPVSVEYGSPEGEDQFEARFVPCMEDQVTAIIRNVTACRRAEAALRASEERLRAAQKMEAIGRLAGGVAHDFNNQLTVILARLQMMQRSAGMRDSDLAHVHEATEAAARAATLTRRLLALSRRQVLAPTVFDLNEVVAEMHGMLGRILGDHIVVTTDLDDAIGPIRSEQAQVEQVILNLALNARDAMTRGGTLALSTRELTLDPDQAHRCDAAGPGRYVVLAVTDTGCGMAREAMDHLFEPFFTTKNRGQTAGLGLATVYGIAKQSGGHVVVHSRTGAGTTVEVCFPRANTSSVGPALGATGAQPETA